MDLDIGYAQIASLVASSTTEYLIKISPVLLLVAGVIFAFVVMDWLVFLLVDLVAYSRGGGYASGEFMSSLSGLTDSDREYYRSPEYPGNWSFSRYRQHQKHWRREHNRDDMETE